MNHETTPPPHLINFPSWPEYARGSASKRTAFANSKRQAPLYVEAWSSWRRPWPLLRIHLSFFRLDYEFCDEDGSIFRSYDLDIPKEKQKQRNEAITLALRSFSGSDAATTVLSAIVHQSTAGAIARGLRNVDGFEMAHLRLISAMNTNVRKVYGAHREPARIGRGQVQAFQTGE